MFNPFRKPARSGGWHLVGLESTFPDIALDNGTDCQVTTSCKAFNIPKTNSPENPPQVDLGQTGDLKDQVLVFKYKGNIHAIDHQCPHSAFPLSQGSIFDIEDFGITLSAGITCPKHGWSFDLFTGQSDRNRYKLKVWEVELRDAQASDGTSADADKTVWVRRKQMIG
ncbi:hypothetical protein PHISCL_03618 [Aspergillus sclerotialis]|uniref:Rieske domain-containing protein n=1 Tax=Aspergillus sclerotialis TaxID=2070753 RepID=A0A3A2ZXI2_9EURO|nr:hypothetical protein PHISCL_03618 [Aspergillus sclerotialis]